MKRDQLFKYLCIGQTRLNWKFDNYKCWRHLWCLWIFWGLKNYDGVTTRDIQKCVSPSGVQFENNEWRLYVSGGEVLFVFLTISVVKLHNCVRNNIIQHRVYTSVWVKKLKERSFWAGKISWLNMPKKKKTRVALSHMWDMCIYYIDSHRGINSVGYKLPKEERYPWKCSASKSIASNHDCLGSQNVK